MLRPMQISRAPKARLVLDCPSTKLSSINASLNVTPLISASAHLQYQNSKSEINEIKPQKKNAKSQIKTHTASLPKNPTRFSQEISNSKSRIRIKTQNFKNIEKKEQTSKLINIFLENLSQNQVFRSKDPQNLQLKLETLRNIVQYIVTSFISKNGDNFNYLSSIFKEKNLHLFLQNNRIFKPYAISNKRLKLVSGYIRITLDQNQPSGNPNQMKKEVNDLQKNINLLKNHKVNLQSEIKATIQQLDEAKRQFLSISDKVASFSIENDKIETRVKENKTLLQKLDGLTTQIYQFAQKNPQGVVKESAENYKNLEGEMFKLTELVSHCANGKKDFQKSITMWDIQKRMEPELKMFNKFLIQNTHSTYQEKCKELKDFLIRINSQYSKIYEQLVHVIEVKTKYIKSFGEYIQLWEQSYLQKSEFLNKLRTNFVYHSLKIEEFKQQCSSQRLQEQKISICQKVIHQAQDIIDLFKMGNYFY